MQKLWAALPAMAAIGGCTSLPEAEFRYFPAQAIVSVTVTQTVECTNSKPKLVFTYSPLVLTTYASDRRPGKERTLSTNSLRSAFADADVTMTWFEDGRLKSINQSSTGQGEAVVKAALTVLAPIIGGAASPSAKECENLASFGGGKPVAIVYEATFRYDGASAALTVPLQAAKNSQHLVDKFSRLLPTIELVLKEPKPIDLLVEAAAPSGDTIPLLLNRTAVVPVSLTISKVEFWKGEIVVPTDETYPLAIPKPKLFGKQAFALTLNEAGAITSMGYGASSGTAGAFNTLGAVAGAKTAGDSAEAAALKAEADLIAQRTRLAACKANPAECK